MANFGADFLDKIIDFILGRLDNEIMRVKILELVNTKAALELADAIETMFSLV